MNMPAVPWVDAVDVANAALFLASDEARYIGGVLACRRGCHPTMRWFRGPALKSDAVAHRGSGGGEGGKG